MEEAIKAAPDQPWLWRSDWARGCVVANRFTHEALGVWVLFGLIMLGFCGVAFLLGALSADETGQFSINWSLCLPAAVIVGFFVYAVYVTWRWKQRGGATLFTLSTLPGRTGGELAGVVNLARRPKAAKGFTVNLQCVRVIVKEEAADEREILHTLSPVAAAPLVPHETGASRLEFSITIRIPAECPPNTADSDYEGIQWELSVKACATGDDFQAVFEVPVFAPGAARA